MVRPTNTANERLLTEMELELMTIVWGLGEATVNDVVAKAKRKLAYTTVSTILRILEQKGILESRKQGRGHVYIPRVLKADYEKAAISDVVKKVFAGEPVAVVRQLLDTQKISSEELIEIKRLLDDHSDKQNDRS